MQISFSFYLSTSYLGSVLAVPPLRKSLVLDPPSIDALRGNLSSIVSTPHNLTNEYVMHRIEGTPTRLEMNIRTADHIEPANLARTLVQTQLRLRRSITSLHRARDEVLVARDDPYVSEERLSGCFVGVAHWPMERRIKQLTYGMVDDTFTGILDVLWKQERYAATDFWIVDDRYGKVGIGRVDRNRPPLRGPLSDV
ncbi:MAG: hypothetical protein Q9191_004581 [Dirinaria sp. TL-2023a]